MAVGRKTGGRKKGTPNKATRDVRELALVHAPRAIARLAELVESDDGRTAVAAAKELLDRAHGRPAQAVEVAGAGVAAVEPGGGVVVFIPDNGRGDQAPDRIGGLS